MTVLLRNAPTETPASICDQLQSVIGCSVIRCDHLHLAWIVAWTRHQAGAGVRKVA